MAKAPNPNQSGFDFGDIDEVNLKDNAEKARQKVKDFYTSDPEYAKKVEQREEAKKQDETMREIVKEKAAKRAAAQPSMISPSGNTTAAGRGTAYKGGSGGGSGEGAAAELKMLNNPKAMKKGGKVKKYDGGGSIRIDRSPKYSDSQMASVREQLDKNEKAAKPENDKNVARYNKAMDEVTKRTQPNMSNMNPAGDTFKKGGVAKCPINGIALRGKTRAKHK